MASGSRDRAGKSRYTSPQRRSADEGSFGRVAWEWTKSIAVAFVLFLVIRTFLVQAFKIPTGSMENTLLVGDFLLVNKAVYGSEIPITGTRLPGYNLPERQDVVVFLPPHDPTKNYVKRIVGLPGDTLEMRDRVLYVNGEPQEEPYVVHADIGDEMHPWMDWQREYLPDGVDPLALGGREIVLRRHGLRHAQHAVQRRADLVAHRRQEPRLRMVRVARFLRELLLAYARHDQLFIQFRRILSGGLQIERLARHGEHHSQKIGRIAQVVSRVDERLADRFLV